jgi:hypothetical protein
MLETYFLSLEHVKIFPSNSTTLNKNRSQPGRFSLAYHVRARRSLVFGARRALVLPRSPALVLSPRCVLPLPQPHPDVLVSSVSEGSYSRFFSSEPPIAGPSLNKKKRLLK